MLTVIFCIIVVVSFDIVVFMVVDVIGILVDIMRMAIVVSSSFKNDKVLLFLDVVCCGGGLVGNVSGVLLVNVCLYIIFRRADDILGDLDFIV